MDNFRVLLLEISRELTREEVRSMKFSLRDLIPAGVLETIETPTDLFTQLENMGLLSATNRHLLADMLQKLGRVDLRSKVMGIRAPEIIKSNKQVDESMMNRISEDLGSKWKTLGRELKIKEGNLDNIELDFPRSARERAYQVMLKWKQMNGRRATEGALASALERIGRTDIAQKLSRDLQGHITASIQTQDEARPPAITAPPTDQHKWAGYSAHVMAPPSDQHKRTLPMNNQHVQPDAAPQIQPVAAPAVESIPPRGYIDSPGYVHQPKLGSYLNPEKYKIQRLLGTGSFAKVYLVNCLRLHEENRLMAVKQVDLGENNEKTKQMVNALKKEWEMLRKLQNEHILRVYYIEEEPEFKTLNLFMEWMPGGSITQWVEKHKVGIPMERIRSYTLQILKGLQYLHENRIIHRDIKGQNILIGENHDRVKLADFGISEEMEKLQKATGTGFKDEGCLGAIYWKCPELIEATGFKETCDIWSLGCTVVEMFTTKPPFGDLSTIQAYNKIMRRETKPPQGCPPDMADFITRCFRDITGRPGASELLQHEYVNYESPLL